jgi:hypothetical protein
MSPKFKSEGTKTDVTAQCENHAVCWLGLTLASL